MLCPTCGERTRVTETREPGFEPLSGRSQPKCLRLAEGAASHYTEDVVARRRVCPGCGVVLYTIELLVEDLLRGWTPSE